jgi:hypothetical protein
MNKAQQLIAQSIKESVKEVKYKTCLIKLLAATEGGFTYEITNILTGQRVEAGWMHGKPNETVRSLRFVVDRKVG